MPVIEHSAPDYNRSALVVWAGNGRREWLPLSDIDKRNAFDRAMRAGAFSDVERFADDIRSGVLPRNAS